MFGERVWFAGLQGSYARGEAHDASDIDTVVILDELTAADIQTYRMLLDTLPYRERLCGFVSGKEELLRWDSSDLFSFYYDTTPLVGSLDELLPLIDDTAIDRAIKLGVCNMYHGCVHNMVFDHSEDMVKDLYKSATFVIRAIQFRKMGTYRNRVCDLLSSVDEDERVILDTFLRLTHGEAVQFDAMSETLVTWLQKQIRA